MASKMAAEKDTQLCTIFWNILPVSATKPLKTLGLILFSLSYTICWFSYTHNKAIKKLVIGCHSISTRLKTLRLIANPSMSPSSRFMHQHHNMMTMKLGSTLNCSLLSIKPKNRYKGIGIQKWEKLPLRTGNNVIQ